MNYENEILAELKRCPGTAADVAHALDVTVADIRADLREMRSNGVLEMGARGTYQVVGSDKGQRVTGSADSVKDSQMAKAPLPERGKAVKKKAAAAAKKPEKKAGTQKAPAAPVKKKPANKSTADKALIDQPTLSDVLNAMEQRLSKPLISNKAEKEKALARLAEMSDEPLRSLLVEIADDLSVIDAA